jgi:quercetin dioxygenase-like cupin family protein
VAAPIGFDQLQQAAERSKIFEGHEHGAPVSFFLVDVDPGEGPALHQHPYVEVFVVQEGTATFTVGEATMEVVAGHIVVAPADVPHAFVNSGSSALRTVNIHPVPRMETVWLGEG